MDTQETGFYFMEKYVILKRTMIFCLDLYLEAFLL